MNQARAKIAKVEKGGAARRRRRLADLLLGISRVLRDHQARPRSRRFNRGSCSRISSTRGRPTTNIGPSRHPGRPVRTGHSGNKVSAFQRALDAGGTAEPQRSTRCDYGAQQGALDQPHRALTNPSDPALIPRVRRDTGAAQRRSGFNELGFPALHEDGRDIVRVRGCVKTCSEIHAITWSGNGRARHGGPLDLELHVGVLGRPRAVRGVAGLEV